MTSLEIVAIDEQLLVGFLLASVRTAAWLFIAPPFGRVIPPRVRAGLAFALALVMAPSNESLLPDGVVGLAASVGFQAFVGLATGFIVLAFISVFTVAGSIIDINGGFAMAAVFDPMSGSASAIVSRAYTLLATVLIFATGGHLVLVSGFIRTFQVAPLAGPDLHALGNVALDNISWFFVAAIEIAFPVVAVLLMVELLLGLVARAAPQTNVLTIGFALKTGVVIIALALAVPLLPAAVESVVHMANEAAT